LDPKLSTEYALWYTHADPQPLEPGAMTKLEVAVMPTAYRFKRGNRIRIDLANGDSALTEFGWFHHEYTPDKRGQDTIFHGVRQGMASRERDKCRRLAIEVGIGGHKERLSALLNQRRERGPEVAFHRGFSDRRRPTD
jgi:hypothetical protein